MRPAFFALFVALWCGAAMAQDLPRAEAVFPQPDMAQVRLGRLLFYDPILSGNRTLSCASCHHPRHGTSDGLALGLGDGGLGLGPDRRVDPDNLPEQRVPRNAPALFNLGASEFRTFFHDGRLEADATAPGGIRTPLGADMVSGFGSLLSAQTMFPVLSPDEMAGHYSENEVSQAVRQGLLTGPGGAWSILAERVAQIGSYRTAFDQVIGSRAIEFTDISDAIAGFMAFEWRADNSPFDVYLRGGAPLAPDAQAGMALFYGKAGCSRCHAGQFQTDHRFHAIAMPQIGPGKAARFERHQRDTGRMRVTGDAADAFRFRTPSLRNVALTAPYGHAGSHSTLRAVILHHLDPVAGLRSFDTNSVTLPDLPGAGDFSLMTNGDEVDAIAAANTLAPVKLTDAEIDWLVAFMGALTDPISVTGRLGVPATAPSGLPVDQ